MKRLIRSFESQKAHGPDYIDVKFIGKTENASIEILYLLYSVTYTWGHFPEGLKRRWIIPLLKPGDKGWIMKN